MTEQIDKIIIFALNTDLVPGTESVFFLNFRSYLQISNFLESSKIGSKYKQPLVFDPLIFLRHFDFVPGNQMPQYPAFRQVQKNRKSPDKLYKQKCMSNCF